MAGFKNASGGLNSVREQPVFQQSFEALKGVFRIGTLLIFCSTKDLAVAQMLLGNADMDSTLVYAKRDKSAVHDFAKLSWVHDRAETSTPQQAGRPAGICCFHTGTQIGFRKQKPQGLSTL
jgi:hypothetical protein